MREFDYEKLAKIKWDCEIINLLGKIHECKGRQELFIRQKPKELTRLVDIAKIQSTVSSNKIEGIFTSDDRLKKLIKDKVAPKDRDENEIMGYRDVLNVIHESHDFIDIKSSVILQLHRELTKKAGLSYCGKFKDVQNRIVEKNNDGSETLRFMPLSPLETPEAVQRVCDNYNETIAKGEVDALLIIPVFILDFLCIHPFNDGNGRMSRLLTLLLLYKSGYMVGKYISIEHEIEKTKDLYYGALEQSDDGWNAEENDPTPFVRYMLKLILACYVDFEERVNILDKSITEKSTGRDVVYAYLERKIGTFKSSDVIVNCPSIARTQVLNILKELVEQGAITKHGQGKNTFYTRNSKQF